MSNQTLEDSPLSDMKMDISETTTSQESPGFSPDIENLSNKADTDNKLLQLTDNLNSTLNNDDTLNNREMIIDEKHMNDIKNISTLNKSELTLVNNHPLMSPQLTDSDSENGHNKIIFHYPDVVPVNETIHLSNVNGDNINRSPNSIVNNQICKGFSSNNIDVISDSNNMGEIHIPTRRKISVLKETSPECFSSGSDTDLSQYQAAVAPTYQSVALISTNVNKNNTISFKQTIKRKITLSADILSDDVSSIDTLSNHSFEDDDLDQLVASHSPESSAFDDTGFNERHVDNNTPTMSKTDPLPQYSAVDETRNSRNWQKITLPDGQTREIDMKVIEPYKRVLSHGGYLKAGGHNAIIIFSACYLPDRSRADYHYVMDNLFLYVIKTLEQLVTEDYVLIYLHGCSQKNNTPSFPWLRKCYQLLDRKLRKSLKNLYMVHPTFWLKSLVWMSRPFVSSKFWKKLLYVRTLEELYTLVPVEKAAVPDKVKMYDSKNV